MDAAAKLGRNPVSKHQNQLEYGDEQADAGRDCQTRSQDRILRRERGQGNNHFPCSADHVQDWQPYSVDPYSCYMCDHTYIPVHIFNMKTFSFYVCVCVCVCLCLFFAENEKTVALAIQAV